MGILRTCGSALLILLIASATATAAPGDLDSAFGAGGIAAIGSGEDFDDAEPVDIAVAPDGKLVIVGRLAGPTNAYGFIARLTAGGAPDPTFDGDGLALTLLSNSFAALQAVAVQPDGKIVVGGYLRAGASQDVPAVARFNGDGAPDPTFNAAGTPGVLGLTGISATDAQIEALALQPDGKIVAVANVDGPVSSGRALRVTTTGVLDTTFNSPTGWRTTVFNLSFSSFLYGVKIRPDGRGVACGSGGDSTDDVSFGFAGHSATGASDSAFGAGTFLVPQGNSGMNDVCRDIAFQSNGSLIAAGRTTDGSSSGNAALTRITSGGAKDPAFGTGGEIIEKRGDDVSFASDVEVDAEDKIYAVGRARVNSVGLFGIWAHLPDGAPNPQFGDNGFVGLSLGGGWANASAINGNRLYVLGSSDGIKLASLKLKDDPVIPPAAVTARARITSPTKSRLARKKLRRVAGTAAASGTQVAKVEVAIERVGAKKSKRCSWLKNTRAKFRTFKKTKAGCKRMVWLKAAGTSKWSLKLMKPLPAGRYRIFARATPAGAAPESEFSRGRKNLRSLKLTR